MNTTTRQLVIGVLCLSAAGSGAMAAPTTNLVQGINIKLTAYVEGPPSTNKGVISTSVNKITRQTKDIIQLLGSATANTFSPSAKLLLISPLPQGDSAVVVQDGNNKVDVSGFFNESNLGPNVQSYQTNSVTGVEKSTAYRIIELALKDNDSQKLSAHFDVTGFATIKGASLVKSAVILGDAQQITASLAGPGDFTDDTGLHEIVVQVSLTVVGTTLLVSP